MTRLLAISPHLDDAVLSFGAGLAQAVHDGVETTVFTIFAGSAEPPYSPAAERLHEIWGIAPDQDASLVRRKEDIAALGHLGVGCRHGRFLDSIYRKAPDGRWLADHVPGGQKLKISRQSPRRDGALFSAVKADIGSLVEELAPTLIVTCAGISNHVDNEITRDTALIVAHERGIPVRLWEDLPHALFGPGSVELPEGFRLGAPELGAVSAEARERKFQALQHYASQLMMLDGPGKDLFGQLERYAVKNSPDGGYRETTWSAVADEDDG